MGQPLSLASQWLALARMHADSCIQTGLDDSLVPRSALRLAGYFIVLIALKVSSKVGILLLRWRRHFAQLSQR